MLKKSFFSLFLLLFLVFSAEVKAQPYNEVVSLGYSCQVAWQLESNQVRVLAYPFDWLHTSLESLLAFIDKKGVNFFDLDQLTIIGPYPGSPTTLHVIDNVYGMISYHDFWVNPSFGNYADVKAKYDRRIQRFFSLLNSHKKVLFVREGGSRSQIEYLDYVLHHLYPKLSYTILAVNNSEEYHTDWGLKRIKNFYLEQTPGNWQGDFARWKEILSTFPINLSNQARNPEEVW